MARKRRRRSQSIGNDFGRWFGYGVLFSLLPLVLHFLYLRTQVPLATQLWSTLKATLANGDLFLLTCCIGGGAIGERIGSTPIRPLLETLLGFVGLISVVLSVFFYSLTFGGALHNTGVVATLSCTLFILAVIVSAGFTFIKLQERHRR